MKTLRAVLGSSSSMVYSEDVDRMAKKLGITLKRTEQGDIERVKGQVVVTQFQIQFGLDEEF